MAVVDRIRVGSRRLDRRVHQFRFVGVQRSDDRRMRYFVHDELLAVDGRDERLVRLTMLLDETLLIVGIVAIDQDLLQTDGFVVHWFVHVNAQLSNDVDLFGD